MVTICLELCTTYMYCIPPERRGERERERKRDRQTDRRTDTGENITSLAEVKSTNTTCLAGLDVGVFDDEQAELDEPCQQR